MTKWVLVDALNLAFRCFHAVPELSRSDGFPTNALHGWIRSLWRVADEFGPARFVVVFDLGEDREKLELLPEYKQQRKEMPEALAKQLPGLKECCRLMGLPAIDRTDTEADDLIATLAARYSGAGDEVLILSADKDIAQCVGPRVRMLLPPASSKTKAGLTVLDEAGVETKFGVPPERIPDWLALIGDSSDNIPGLSGVGPKTASKWLQEHGDLEGVISNAADIKPPRFREIIPNNIDLLRRNLRLTRLNASVDVASPADSPPDTQGLVAFLQKMEMKGAAAEAERRAIA